MRLLKQAAILAALMFCTAPLLAPAAVSAQEVVSVAATAAEPTFLQELVLALMPVIGLIVTGILGLAANELHRRTGIDIEARHREALQSALMNGILFALQKSNWLPGQAVTPTMLSVARDYVASSVPDALQHFNISPTARDGIAILDKLLTPKVPVATGTVMPNGDKLVGRAP